MFWMMNGMGPHGRSMHHRGFFPMGGLFLVPGILFGGLFGLYAILAVLNVAGVVISAVLSGLAHVFAGLIEAFGSVFSGIFSGTGTRPDRLPYAPEPESPESRGSGRNLTAGGNEK